LVEGAATGVREADTDDEDDNDGCDRSDMERSSKSSLAKGRKSKPGRCVMASWSSADVERVREEERAGVEKELLDASPPPPPPRLKAALRLSGIVDEKDVVISMPGVLR
jgi:hypothetical protein